MKALNIHHLPYAGITEVKRMRSWMWSSIYRTV